jgi:hypothetical protein
MNDELTFENLETVYDLIAAAIDDVGPQKESLFLAKLCLALAHCIADRALIEDAIAAARLDLNA